MNLRKPRKFSYDSQFVPIIFQVRIRLAWLFSAALNFMDHVLRIVQI
jgi:hypothetical protein